MELANLATTSAREQDAPAVVIHLPGSPALTQEPHPAEARAENALPQELFNVIARFAPPADVANLSAVSKTTHDALKDDPRLVDAQFCDKRRALENQQWKAARAARRANDICSHWLALPLNLATAFIPSMLIRRHYAKKAHEAHRAVQAHAQSRADLYPMAGAANHRSSEAAELKGRRAASWHREHLKEQLSELFRAEDHAVFTLGHMCDNDFFDAFGMVVFTGGLYLVACTLGSAYYALRHASLERQIADAKLEAGTLEQQIRAAVAHARSEGDSSSLKPHLDALAKLDEIHAKYRAGENPKITSADMDLLRAIGIDFERIGRVTLPQLYILVAYKIREAARLPYDM